MPACSLMPLLRPLLPLAILALTIAPSHAGWVDETVNRSIESVGRATLSPQSLSKDPQAVVQSLASQVATGASITPEAATSLLTDLKNLDRDKLDTVAANVSTCILVDCHGVPGDKVAALASRVLSALQTEADQQANLWTRGVAIISVLVALLSVIVNIALNLANRRKAKAAA
jgi:hypothetical protein